MQNQTKDDFSEKTDRLADALKLPIKELAAAIGISADSLSGYRTGRLKISPKAWRKLRQAEIKAGLAFQTTQTVSDRTIREIPQRVSPADPRHAGMVAESSSPYGERTDWQDVEAYVRALKLTHRKLSPEEVLDVLRDEFPIGPEKKT